MSNINKEILDEDPDSQAVEADESVQYEPNSDSLVVAVEPKIITLGRKKRRDILHNLPDQTSHT
jgi:hypothetical protein